ncbi:MAG TPA: glycerol-3-phosphate 1-O-acyltransferase PlsY [Verrucomicrobiae bacterium]
MLILGYVVIALGAYLLGSIPTGYLVAKARGVDIRSVGSGNIGATNAFRVLGKPAGAFVLLADGLKGFVASAWGCSFALSLLQSAGTPLGGADGYRILAGIAAVLGHNYTCWLHFKGGKGIATSAGVYVALAPLAVTWAIGAWLVLFLLTRYVSVASIASAIALPTAVWLTKESVTLGIVTTGLGVLAIAKHRANIQRLMNGTENRVHFKAKSPTT